MDAQTIQNLLLSLGKDNSIIIEPRPPAQQISALPTELARLTATAVITKMNDFYSKLAKAKSFTSLVAHGAGAYLRFL